ncbi:MAG: SxtJ family membrane protein [Luteolibacter sp.]
MNPSEGKLRQFGQVAPIMLLLIACLLKWRFDLPLTGMAAMVIVGILILILSKLSSKLVKPVYLALVLIGFPIGWVISHLIMLIFFFGIITPVALVFRLMGRDALHRNWDPKSESYWTEHPRSESVGRYFKQF